MTSLDEKQCLALALLYLMLDDNRNVVYNVSLTSMREVRVSNVRKLFASVCLYF